MRPRRLPRNNLRRLDSGLASSARCRAGARASLGLLVLALVAFLFDAPPFALAQGQPPGTGVRGVVVGPATAGTAVLVYRGHLDRPAGPHFVARAFTDAKGAFEIQLGPGPYTLRARWRTSGQPVGPLSVGDRVATARVVVEAGQYADAGMLSLREIDPAVRATISLDETGGAAASIFGRVVNPSGEPVSGLLLLAFTDPGMGHPPVAHSLPSAPDGRFRLPLPSGGVYFVVARSRGGGPIGPGEVAGFHAGPDGTGIPVPEGGSVEGITVTVDVVR